MTTAREVSLVLAACGIALTPSMDAAEPPVYLSEIVRISETSVVDDFDIKSLEALCPPGMSVIGGSGRVSSIAPVIDVLTIAESRPMDAPAQGWIATAYETSPASGDWWIETTAVCAETTDVQVVISQTNNDSIGLKYATAQCPADTVALGGGVRVEAFLVPTNLTVSGSILADDGTAWKGRGHEIKATDLNWDLTVYVVCGNLMNPSYLPDHYSRLSGTTLLSRFDCDPGTDVLGGGASLGGGETLPIALRQIGTSVPAITITFFGTIDTLSGSWTVTSRARCVTPVLFGDGFETGTTTRWSQ